MWETSGHSYCTHVLIEKYEISLTVRAIATLFQEIIVRCILLKICKYKLYMMKSIGDTNYTSI